MSQGPGGGRAGRSGVGRSGRGGAGWGGVSQGWSWVGWEMKVHGARQDLLVCQHWSPAPAHCAHARLTASPPYCRARLLPVPQSETRHHDDGHQRALQLTSCVTGGAPQAQGWGASRGLRVQGRGRGRGGERLHHRKGTGVEERAARDRPISQESGLGTLHHRGGGEGGQVQTCLGGKGLGK